MTFTYLSYLHNVVTSSCDLQPGADLIQSFLSGSDAWLTKVCDSSVRTAQDCELRAQMLTEDCSAMQDVGRAPNHDISETSVQIF